MNDDKRNYTVSREDWSLHRKGYQDQKRHMDKVKDAIRNNLPDLISEENIIMSNGRDVVKIPIRSLDEYKIRYNHDKSKQVGQGDGESDVGDVIGRDPNSGDQGKNGSGQGKQAGDQAGSDYYEADVSMTELEEALFEELELPNLHQKDEADITTEDIEFNDVRKKGLMGNVDKKRTILSALKRNAMKGKTQIAPIYNDDLRFKTWNDVIKPESKAVIMAMMDTSASMGNFEKYLARSFFFWMLKFLRTKYESVEIVFIAHHTEAKVVTEEAFFSKGESGGTICSSAYEKALELMADEYSPDRYNIYPFHFSDGENITSDNPKCVRLVEDIMAQSNLFGYAEVNVYNRQSTLMRAYSEFRDPKFRHYILKGNQDVYHALKQFFQKETATV
ncbi:sporulation protein YhbH [Lentibacillus halophilus]|uniref:Sporulation protein YhbH n=1 Tax=Lentibacillus halophilus TaxID=295065 RepID=A0ABN0Z7K6_9BACI